MSTANFHVKNAGLTYAREFGADEDGFEYGDFLEELREAFRTAAEDPGCGAIADFEDVRNTWETDGLRSYPGRIVARLESRRNVYREFDAFLSADIIVRSGYYAGVNLDYDLLFSLDGDDGCETFREDGIDDICLHSEPPGTRRAYLLGLARKWFDRAALEFTEAIEAVFREHSTPLRLVARASNGEAFYEQA